MQPSQRLTLCLLLAIFLSFQASSQWVADSTVNNLVHNGTGDDNIIETVSDDAGGAVIIFSKGNLLLAQKVNNLGQVVWGKATEAKPVSDEPASTKIATRVVSDSAGGVYIAWSQVDNGSYTNIYVQHINSAGDILWGNAGKKISFTGGVNNANPLLSVATGGHLFVAWTAFDPIEQTIRVKVQQFTNNGIQQWDAGGKEMTVQDGFNLAIGLVASYTDVIVFYEDSRNDHNNGNNYYAYGSEELTSQPSQLNKDIFCQKFNTLGEEQWFTEDVGMGAPVCTAEYSSQKLYSFSQTWANAVPDGNGGGIISFYDSRGDGVQYRGGSIYTQKVSADGVIGWGNVTTGAKVWEFSSPFGAKISISKLRCASDKLGGAYVIWTWTLGVPIMTNVIAEHIGSEGTALWGIRAFAKDGSNFTADDADVAVDNQANLIVAYRTALTFPGHRYVYAKKLSPEGVFLWGEDGAGVCSNESGSYYNNNPVPFICKDASDNMIVSWTDERNLDNGKDIYVSKIDVDGKLVSTPNSNASSAKSGYWADPTIWSGGLFPNTITDVVVTHDITITADAVCRSLKVIPPAKITVLPNVHLTILQ